MTMVLEQPVATEILTTDDDLMERLAEATHAGDARTFARIVRGVDWSTRTPDELYEAITMSLQMMLAWLSIHMAQEGSRLFPDHEGLQRAAKVIAPPRIVGKVKGPPVKGIRESHKWMDEHAHEYSGQWIAVNQGKLLGTAPTLPELDEMIGQPEDAASTIFVRVL